MAFFHPELVKLGTSSYSLVSVLDQAMDLVLNSEILWSTLDQTVHYFTEAANWIFTKLPK